MNSIRNEIIKNFKLFIVLFRMFSNFSNFFICTSDPYWNHSFSVQITYIRNPRSFNWGNDSQPSRYVPHELIPNSVITKSERSTIIPDCRDENLPHFDFRHFQYIPNSARTRAGLSSSGCSKSSSAYSVSLLASSASRWGL